MVITFKKKTYNNSHNNNRNNSTDYNNDRNSNSNSTIISVNSKTVIMMGIVMMKMILTMIISIILQWWWPHHCFFWSTRHQSAPIRVADQGTCPPAFWGVNPSLRMNPWCNSSGFPERSREDMGLSMASILMRSIAGWFMDKLNENNGKSKKRWWFLEVPLKMTWETSIWWPLFLGKFWGPMKFDKYTVNIGELGHWSPDGHLPCYSLQGGAPQWCLLVYNPMKTIDRSPTKTIVIGVMFTNLAI